MVLRHARHRRHALRDGGDRGEARAEGEAEEGDGVGGRWALNQPSRTRTPLSTQERAPPRPTNQAAVSSSATPAPSQPA